MNLPSFFSKLKRKQTEHASEIFLSLIVHVEWIHAAAWDMGPGRKPRILGISLTNVRDNTWDARTEACDRLLGELEEKIGIQGPKKVVFGLPSVYLTENGEIDKTVKREIRQMSEVLELIPLGFVALADALLYCLRQEEGVPTNIILIDVSRKHCTIALYKIGKLIGQKTVTTEDDVVGPTEAVLRSFHDVEILPSRMLLFDGDAKMLEQVQSALLHHSWSTRANFLHFPKIDILPAQELLRAVSLAGASEQADQISEGEAEEPVEDLQTEHGVQTEAREEQEEDRSRDESVEAQESADEVIVVEPEALGFRRKQDAAIGERSDSQLPNVDKEEEEDLQHPVSSRQFHLPAFARSAFGGFVGFIQHSISQRAAVGLIIAVCLVSVILGFLYWMLPRATVTIYLAKKTIDESGSVTIDPTATITDSVNMIIPGRKREQSISGEKVIPVEGKKKIGDPAKGVVTIYNKSLSARMFKNGTVLAADSLQFTLDSDIQVASASENLVNGTVTFGKAAVPITAAAIGEGGNLPAGKEFSFKDTAPSIAVARNDAPLFGGSSKEATVVTRADYDALVKILTGELVEKAKGELAAAVTGKELLIDETIATTVKEKSFTRELDSEAGELGGKLALVVSGISYSQDDIASLFIARIKPTIPSGYEITSEQMSVKATSVKVNKKGQITLQASVGVVALPVLDDTTIGQHVAGKTIAEVQEYLRHIEGVGGVGFDLRYTLSKKRLPINRNNIVITHAMSE